MKRTYGVLWSTGLGLLLICGCGYRIEEAATKIPLSVRWTSDIRSIECCRFTQLLDAQEYFQRENEGVICRDRVALNNSGDTISVTRLTSGFDSSRLLHKFLVFDLHINGGQDERLLVRVTEEMISTGVLELEITAKEGANEKPESSK